MLTCKLCRFFSRFSILNDFRREWPSPFTRLKRFNVTYRSKTICGRLPHLWVAIQFCRMDDQKPVLASQIDQNHFNAKMAQQNAKGMSHLKWPQKSGNCLVFRFWSFQKPISLSTWIWSKSLHTCLEFCWAPSETAQHGHMLSIRNAMACTVSVQSQFLLAYMVPPCAAIEKKSWNKPFN